MLARATPVRETAIWVRSTITAADAAALRVAFPAETLIEEECNNRPEPITPNALACKARDSTGLASDRACFKPLLKSTIKIVQTNQLTGAIH
jgi:hypothetical protein